LMIGARLSPSIVIMALKGSSKVISIVIDCSFATTKQSLSSCWCDKSRCSWLIKAIRLPCLIDKSYPAFILAFVMLARWHPLPRWFGRHVVRVCIRCSLMAPGDISPASKWVQIFMKSVSLFNLWIEHRNWFLGENQNKSACNSCRISILGQCAVELSSAFLKSCRNNDS
jgi:hypothetical protein